MRHLLPVLFLMLLTAYSAKAQQTAEKTNYSIFKPVPQAEMREMETDRPTTTESPITIDAGHLLYETDIARYEHERGEESNQKRWLFNNANVKLGFTNSTDLQIIIQSYGIETSKELSTGKKSTGRGFGDITLRVKQNFAGNDNGNFAIAVVPYVKFPVNTYSENKMYEGGLIVPVEFKLPHEWKVGLQVEGDRLKDDEKEAYHTELFQSVTISHELVKNLEAFLETYYTLNFKEHEVKNFIDAALQLELSKNIKVDGGLIYGLQKHAARSYFVGAALRF